MPFSWFVAKRYFFTRRKQHAVNIITRISVAGIMTGTAGLVIVLSVFNGFSHLVSGLYDAFDPDLKVTPATGKTFSIASVDTSRIKQISGIGALSFTLDENVLVRYGQRQAIAIMKGVDEHFSSVSKVGDYIVDGQWLPDRQLTMAAAGAGLAYKLGMTTDDLFHYLHFYYPDKQADFNTNPAYAFRNDHAKVSAVFSIQQEFDNHFILLPLPFAQTLTGNEGRATALEIDVMPGVMTGDLKDQLARALPPGFVIKDRKEQHAYLLKIFSSEKFAIYLILGFILLLSSFGIIGSLSMLMIEKKKDMQTFYSLGADIKSVRRIFLIDGMLLTAAGLISGLILGTLLCLLQQSFGWIKLGSRGDFVVDAYPVALEATDLIRIGLLVLFLGFLLSRYIVNRMVIKI